MSQQVSKGVPNVAGQKYEFFVTTGHPRRVDDASRATIRRVVMRNFFNDKDTTTDLTKPASELSSTSTIEAGTKLKGRFRLPKPGQVIGPKKPTGKPKRTEKRSLKQNEGVKASKTGRKQSIPCLALEECNRCATEEGNRAPTSPVILLSISPPPGRNPSAHRFDPFDALPIPATFKLEVLLAFYKSRFRINSIAVNARNTWWPFISQDATLLHATMASVALYGDLTNEPVSSRIEALRHKNEAIKGINAKLNSHAEGISDALVGAVAIIASFENLYGAYDTAQLHISALKRMVHSRGGLPAFAHNDGLYRGITWVDFHSSSAFRTPPTFPYLPPHPITPPFPDSLLEEAACFSPTSLLHLSLASVNCFNIFYRLHRLGLATSAHWSSSVDKTTVSNMLYEAEYALLSMADRSQDFLALDRRKGALKDDDESKAADAASIVEALVAAGQIFLYAALREVPPRAKIFSILLGRLRCTLERPGVNTSVIWARERNLHTLLWALMVGAAVAVQWGGSHWWIEQIAEVLEELGLDRDATGREAIKAVLKGVAWTDIFFEPVSSDVWKGVVDLIRLRGGGTRNENPEQGGESEEDGNEAATRRGFRIGMTTLLALSKDTGLLDNTNFTDD